ncbi:hypothetical protein CcaverHIS002_0205280 [Cutaneotrichosporon cavernicola]|uniref:Uncharacterized protein n=1 Tax=Cutaneotrichosporon cavernicola TaxID=279322 RepID=A0AA48IIG6_9TREE|nr:uncharacterized protein CcaverHIS019_0205250 [Cutaneotrichosporon cavernicola]BEI81368.1 hypothetical protein CcaverHIS002_0205280 [Cutaneotrichosporon cavernicola]BEI89163.1 hypothetical protein CcaverHIS019_0205250 [Cutaneotrichosporon cavernicola]BEI96939.1 hypothetical protein CcaverHIS631_0205280 [Cutaneotrichosporon cavernicola]BEJ04711.1 hypothetical protein CcaverHIS641_0205280 [Cutaneotrichosporon cavernicola]
MPPFTRDDSDDTGGSGGGSGGALWFLFFLLLGAGAGGYYWFRVRRRDTSFQLHNLGSSTNALRLSHDGPPADEFISNNASTDSLPGLAAQDVPFLPAATAEAEAAAHGLPHAPPTPSYRDQDPLGAVRKPSPSSGSGSASRDSHSRRSSRNWSPSTSPHNNSNPNPNTVFSLEDDSE